MEDQELLRELKRTKELVGELYPILVTRDGKIVDGLHRAKVGWKSVRRLDQVDSDVKAVLARILVHKVRREITSEEQKKAVNQLAELLLTKKGIKPGRIGPLIAELTGYSLPQIDIWLDEKYKAPKGPKPALQAEPLEGVGVSTKPAEMGAEEIGEQIRESGRIGGRKGGRPAVWLWMCPKCGFKGPKSRFAKIRAEEVA
jgi:hypothetical protein